MVLRTAFATFFAAAMMLPSLAFAQTGFQTVFKLTATPDKADAPYAGVVADENGVLYSAATEGGMSHQGAVFALVPPASGGTWTESDLFDFSGSDGANPYGTLVLGAGGVVYGTTANGGAKNDGTVFALTPPAQGQTAWTETMIWSFAGSTDGAHPFGALIADSSGNLYGTTEYGGTTKPFCARGCGTVFKLTPPAPGKTAWTKTTLYKFSGTDGYYPYAGVIADQNGVLYGTTIDNSNGYGTVYSLTPQTSGAWTEKTLFVIPTDYSQGAQPFGGLVMSSGVLYGTTSTGGLNGGGVAFSLTPAGSGKWTEAVVADLAEKTKSSLVADSSGNLYGTGLISPLNSMGTVFELSPVVGQLLWTETELWFFKGGSGGTHPSAPVLIKDDGTVYGTTTGGDNGVVFSLTP